MTLQIETFSDADYRETFIADPLISLAPFNIRMMLRRNAADATVYLDLTTMNGGIGKIPDVPATTDVAAVIGRYEVIIGQVQLLRLPVGVYVFSVIATDTVRRIEVGRGKFTHSAGPTRWATASL